MTREERNLEGLVLAGSDHLTAYNLYAEAFAEHGHIGQVYGLPRQLFDDTVSEWAEWRGALVKAIEDAALGMASIYRTLELSLPDRMPIADERIHRRFAELVARLMPFDLVIDEQTASGAEARVSKTSVCGSWGAIAGELRYFADRFGIPRASIEGTQLPYDLVRKYATHGAPTLAYDPRRKRTPLVLVRRVEYHGFELEEHVEPLEGAFPPAQADEIRRALALGLARFEARHLAVKRNRRAIEELREVYRRSGGATPRFGERELADWYASRLGDIHALDELQSADLVLDPDTIVPPDERARWLALPDAVTVRDRDVPIDYDVEEGVGGVARLRLPEKLARTLHESELPSLDRPLRFTVTRGQRGAVRADTLEELQEALELPWTPDEVVQEDAQRPRGQGGRRRHGRGDGQHRAGRGEWAGPRPARPERGRPRRGRPGRRRRG
jgi:hypothetical protein